MRVRHWATVARLAAGAVAATFLITGATVSTATTPALLEASHWSPLPLEAPQPTAQPVLPSALAAPRLPHVPVIAPVLPPSTSLVFTLPEIAPPLLAWSREIAAGETLDAVLADAGLQPPVRAEAALAIGAEFDPRQLRPGHVVTVVTETTGALRRLELAVEDGVTIEAIFGNSTETRVRRPAPEVVTLADEARIETSLYAALEAAKLPARFAVDLAEMLGGTFDFRRELSGGETLHLMWYEARVDETVIGQPELTFAALDLGDTLYEFVWPEDGSGPARIYVDGEVLRVFSQPVEGARLTSIYGRRSHPLYGTVRMHTGVDFAAPRGTPVHATAPGRVAYVGWRSGYGRTVEIAHGSDTLTRYAHLSTVPAGFAAGERVMAGDVIGSVGATGTATGPNLHYEVLVDGRPTDPLADDRLATAVEAAAEDEDSTIRLQEARARLQDQLAARPARSPNESN